MTCSGEQTRPFVHFSDQLGVNPIRQPHPPLQVTGAVEITVAMLGAVLACVTRGIVRRLGQRFLRIVARQGLPVTCAVGVHAGGIAPDGDAEAGDGYDVKYVHLEIPPIGLWAENYECQELYAC